MIPKAKKVIPLIVPPAQTDVDAWLVVGLDPSMSRSGFAMMYVGLEDGATAPFAKWVDVGSVKPSEAKEPIWVRGKAMALFLREAIEIALVNSGVYHAGVIKRIGLIISMEYPTPMNDFLVALNRIIHLVFFENEFYKRFAAVHVLTVNASTMRSLMNLTMRGSSNKKENIQRAYEFIDQTAWPQLDTDSCDGVLFAVIAKHVAAIAMGFSNTVPERFLNALCNSNKEVKGSGTRVRIITKGLLHRDEYWYPYERKEYTVLVKDAANPKPGLRRSHFLL